jgi:hypothetical protein
MVKNLRLAGAATTTSLCEGMARLSLPRALWKKESDVDAFLKIERETDLLSVQNPASPTRLTVFIEPLWAYELLGPTFGNEAPAAADFDTPSPHRVLGAMKRYFFGILRTFGEDYVGGIKREDHLRGALLEDACVAGLHIQRAARNDRQQLRDWTNTAGAPIAITLSTFLGIPKPTVAPSDSAKSSGAETSSIVSSAACTDTASAEPAPSAGQSATTQQLAKRITTFVSDRAAHFVKKDAPASSLDVTIRLSTKLFCACGHGPVPQQPHDGAAPPSSTACGGGGPGKVSATFDAKRGATQFTSSYPVTWSKKRSMNTLDQTIRDPALELLFNLTTIKPSGGGKRGNDGNNHNNSGKETRFDATQLLVVPGRERNKNESNPLVDVVFHEYAEDSDRYVQFWVDLSHTFEQDGETVNLWINRIVSGLGNPLLQHEQCAVDRIVFLIITPRLFDDEGRKLDLEALLSQPHTANAPNKAPAVPKPTHKDAIQAALGRLKSFHFVLVQSHDAGLEHLLSQPVAFTLPLLDSRDSDSWEKVLPANTAEWRDFWPMQIPSTASSKVVASIESDKRLLDEWSAGLESRIKRK